MDLLDAATLDTFYTRLRAGGGQNGRPLSASIIREVHAILSGALKQAVVWGWIGHNPAKLATPPAIEKPEVQPPKAEDAARLLATAMAEDPELGLFLRLAVILGARRGELCSLRWSDVNVDQGEILIAGGVVRVHGQPLIDKDTKTHAKRRVAVGAGTLDLLPGWAEEHAGMLLADLGTRWHHVQGVVRQAQRVRQVVSERDRPYLIAAAWLHDIGYAPSLAATAFHPLDGARYVRSLGHERLARLVAYHSSARWEADAVGLGDELAAFPREDSATSDALTYCDMTTSPTGERVTMADCLAEMAERYGPDHLVVRCLQRAHDSLLGAVRRTEERTQAARVTGV